jgi:hypothetical protein
MKEDIVSAIHCRRVGIVYDTSFLLDDWAGGKKKRGVHFSSPMTVLKEEDDSLSSL